MRYCPKCRAEYRDDVRTCSDDGSVLVDQKPTDVPKINQLTVVLTLADRFEAEELADGLADEGLEVALVSNKTRTLGTLTTPGPEIYSLVVPAREAERARNLLAEWRPAYESEKGPSAEKAAEQEANAALPPAI